MAEIRKCTVGLLAHVDAGKTTLSEAMLYTAGVRRSLGRVDHGNAFLDTHELERRRGITIFSKQAQLPLQNMDITLVDTPGHVDFSAETERVLPVLDCAVLVISGTDGIQAHTLTLWRLLARYQVPVFLFINKMDLPCKSPGELLCQLQQRLDPGCVDMTGDGSDAAEQAAMLDESLLEQYLQTGQIADADMAKLIAQRKLFPCCFGSGLKLQNVDGLLDVLERYAPVKTYPREFGAKVYKISRDPQGNRLTWLKVTGGSLQVRDVLRYTAPDGREMEEKLVQLRIYSAEKFTAPEQVSAGQLCAVTGLSATWAGQGLGAQEREQEPELEPVMTYRLVLPKTTDPAVFLPKLRQLEEEDPMLQLYWDGQIHVKIMGKVQLEILRSLVQQRFGLDVQFDDRRICYKETVADTVEGVGHFEPLRHYAEVHLLLEPLPRGSGLVFDTACSTDVLEQHFQRLILTHLEEKTHLGVLTGSPITDMKITLLVGKAHNKHTEGGDFRQATYRAVRQGLMQAQSVLLEPWYRFTLTLPAQYVGRAITDLRAMFAELETPENTAEQAILTGILPAAELGDYVQTLAAYTQGLGQLQLALDGYYPCHNTQLVVEELAYDPEADLENTPDSVFCAHGAGFTVKWHQVQEYMHLESGIKKQPAQPEIISRNLHMDDKELEAIMQREFGPIKRPVYHAPANRPATEEISIRPLREQYIIVDGYNIIFAWDALAETAKSDLDAARRQLCDWLVSYAGYKKCHLILVFDGYKVKGNPGEKTLQNTVQVVYTKENETADAYIEALVHRIGKNESVRVATSDGLVQLGSLRSGVLRMSARELWEEVEAARREMRKLYTK